MIKCAHEFVTITYSASGLKKISGLSKYAQSSRSSDLKQDERSGRFRLPKKDISNSDLEAERSG